MRIFPRKSDAADTFEQFLLIADPKVIKGISSDVLVVGLDGKEELSKGKFGNLCRERNRKKRINILIHPRVQRNNRGSWRLKSLQHQPVEPKRQSCSEVQCGRETIIMSRNA